MCEDLDLDLWYPYVTLMSTCMTPIDPPAPSITCGFLLVSSCPRPQSAAIKAISKDSWGDNGDEDEETADEADDIGTAGGGGGHRAKRGGGPKDQQAGDLNPFVR